MASKSMNTTLFLYAKFKRKHHEYKEFFIYIFPCLYKSALCRKFHEGNTFLYHWERGTLFQKQKIKFTTHLFFKLIYRNILPVQLWVLKTWISAKKITENFIQCSLWKREKVTKECVKEVKKINAKNEKDICEKWWMIDKLFNQYEMLEI